MGLGASCIETPFASARSRNAACSSSVRRNVMAIPCWYQSDTTVGLPISPASLYSGAGPAGPGLLLSAPGRIRTSDARFRNGSYFRFYLD